MQSDWNSKKRQLTDTAMALFVRYGFRRVSVEEICRTASVSKMTFYKFFSNKIDLLREVINDLFDQILLGYKKIMDQDVPFEEKVRQQLIMKFEGTNDISAELVKDIYGGSVPEIHDLWRSRADEMLKMVFNDYLNAQKRGEIRQDMKLEFMIYMSNKTIEIASDPEVQAMYPDMQSVVMEIANMFFYGIFPRESKK